MGASLAKARAGKVRGWAGLEAELEEEGLIAIVKFLSVIESKEFQLKSF